MTLTKCERCGLLMDRGGRHFVDRPWPSVGEYEVRLNTAPEQSDGPNDSEVSWEVWHWPTETAESDWFRASDAFREVLRLTASAPGRSS